MREKRSDLSFESKLVTILRANMDLSRNAKKVSGFVSVSSAIANSGATQLCKSVVL